MVIYPMPDSVSTPSRSSPRAIEMSPSTSNATSMEESLLLFSDGLKDLRSLKSQLYSAAEYFEFSYLHEDSKQPVMENLKDYVLKALVNAVDHLGSMSFKVNKLIQDKVEYLSEIEARFSCIEQEIRTYQNGMDLAGLREHCFQLKGQRFHKRYVLPSGGDYNTPQSGEYAVPSPHDIGLHLDDVDSKSTLFEDVMLLTTKERRPSFKLAASPQLSPSPSIYSPLPSFILGRSSPETEGPSSSSLQTPFPTQNGASKPPLYGAPNIARRFVVEVQKSPSIMKTAKSLRPRVDGQRDIDRLPSKSKHFLKSLLSKRKSRKYGRINSAATAVVVETDED